MDKIATEDEVPQAVQSPSQESSYPEQEREVIQSPSFHTDQEQTQDASSAGNEAKVDDGSKIEILPNIEKAPSKTESSTSPPADSLNSNDVSNAATNTIQEANDEIANLLLENRITAHDSSKIQSVLRENAVLKEKIAKLKTLLTRSAKVSKETKLDLEQHKRLLDVAKKEVERLNYRIEELASRPTHMDLLADFETNFDRALMNLHTEKISPVEAVRQSVGQATEQNKDEENVYNMLMTELNQAKVRVEHMENMNNALKKRTVQLEKHNETLIQERESVNLKMSNLQLELKMARMETENAVRTMKEKEASLAEMQMELELVTKSALNANARAAEGMEVAESAKTDKVQLEEMKAKVSALQEWAIASSRAKEAILEENKMLERKLKEYECLDNKMEPNEQREVDNHNGMLKTVERRLWSKTSSFVVGAGALETRFIELGDVKLMDWETVVLRWKFDITPHDQDIHFSIIRGQVDARKHKDIDFITKDRVVISGGAGEVEGAFSIKNTCTLVWSNEHSWVRPRSIKYVVEAFAIM